MKDRSGNPKGLAPFLHEQDIVSLLRLNMILFMGIAAVAFVGYVIVRDSC